MKIIEVAAFQPPTPGSPPDWRTALGQIIVRMATDDGLVGLGVGGGGAAGIHVVETVLRDLLLSQSPENVEDLHHQMCRHTAFYGVKGLAVMALSGVDLALWDLRGKRRRENVAQLLAPQVELPKKMPTYITAFDEEQIQGALDDGHNALKLHVEPIGKIEDVAGVFQRARKQAGPDVKLMVDAFAAWDVERTLRIADAIAPFNVDWIEEPLQPNDFHGYEVLAKKSPIPIAGGEHEYLAAGFELLIQRGLHSVLQPDVNWCGGLTTLIEIYAMANRAGVRVCPHRGCEPYALPAIAALDPNPVAESPRAWFRCLHGADEIKNGSITLTGRDAGFGVRPVDEV